MMIDVRNAVRGRALESTIADAERLLRSIDTSIAGLDRPNRVEFKALMGPFSARLEEHRNEFNRLVERGKGTDLAWARWERSWEVFLEHLSLLFTTMKGRTGPTLRRWSMNTDETQSCETETECDSRFDWGRWAPAGHGEASDRFSDDESLFDVDLDDESDSDFEWEQSRWRRDYFDDADLESFIDREELSSDRARGRRRSTGGYDPYEERDYRSGRSQRRRR
jgi:hypothetical protein